MSTTRAARRAIRYEQVTIGFNVAEGVVAITAGLLAGSIALVGFGFDSWIEVAAATVVLLRLRAEVYGGRVNLAKEHRALRFVAVTFFVLAIYVVVEGIRDLLVGARPDVSPVGIVVTGLSIVVMPLLARLKRQAGQQMGSRLVVAEAAETRLCAWLSVSTFAGLAAYGAFRWTWLDPAAGFVIAVFAVKEGREAWEGELVCENDDCPGVGQKFSTHRCEPTRPSYAAAYRSSPLSLRRVVRRGVVLSSASPYPRPKTTCSPSC